VTVKTISLNRSIGVLWVFRAVYDARLAYNIIYPVLETCQ